MGSSEIMNLGKLCIIFEKPSGFYNYLNCFKVNYKVRLLGDHGGPDSWPLSPVPMALNRKKDIYSHNLDKIYSPLQLVLIAHADKVF